MFQLNLNKHLADGTFNAMASTCQLLLDTDDLKQSAYLLDLVASETWRIEQKFSRYRQDNIIAQINTAQGKPVQVDIEMAHLLDFSSTLYDFSDGLFDITSGVLRRAWSFDGSDKIPTQAQIDALLPLIGWSKVSWKNGVICLPVGMEIDLGGIGKEYAVDQSFALVEANFDGAFLLNFGGDLRAKGVRKNGQAWQVGIEKPDTEQESVSSISLTTGAIATSGDSKRFLFKDGIRYGHLLNPKTGWPIQGCPRSVTVLAPTCTQAGMLSSFAQLQGSNAIEFLEAQDNIQFWVVS